MTFPDSLTKVAEAHFPTRWGRFRIMGFEGCFGVNGSCRKANAVALVMGDIHAAPPLVRIQPQCLTGDVFGPLGCDCRLQLEVALATIAAGGNGVLIYEHQESNGTAVLAALQAYEQEDGGMEVHGATGASGSDHLALAAAIMKRLGLRRVRLMSDDPDKFSAMEKAGIEVVERIPCGV